MEGNCSSCGKEVTGGFEVQDQKTEEGVPVIAIVSSPDRNFNICDSCNILVCYDCSRHPESGYCDKCYDEIFTETTFRF